MFEGFCLATEIDLRKRRGVVYLIVFDDGCWYCGSTGQSFRLRYGTLTLERSCLLPSATVKSKLQSIGYSVWLHESDFGNHEDRLQKEMLVIGSNIRDDQKCLNYRNEHENIRLHRKIELKSPSGSIVEFESLKQATEFIGCNSHSQICGVLSGRFKSTCGWTLPSYYGKKGHALHRKPCVLVDPSGNEKRFESHDEAKAEIGVSNITPLISGEFTTIKGWTLPGKKRRKYIPVTLLSPTGEVVTFPSRLMASIEIGCCNQLISSLCLGKVSHAKGWKLAGEVELRDH